MAAHQSEAEKRKKYMNVFYALIVLTVAELAVLFLPLPHTVIAILVAILSSSKAVVVGYYYMHLEYETRWLQIVACLPVVAFGYAFFLVIDAQERPPSIYVNEPSRAFSVFKQDVESVKAQEAAEKAQAWLKAEANSSDELQSAPQVKEAEAPLDTGRPEGAPDAVEGADQWR
jgi:caa(3)-type oxidase subunit IV